MSSAGSRTGGAVDFSEQAARRRSVVGSQRMVSSRLSSIAQQRSWRLLCHWQVSNIALAQQQPQEATISSQQGSRNVVLHIPAQQLVATIVTSPEQASPEQAAQPDTSAVAHSNGRAETSNLVQASPRQDDAHLPSSPVSVSSHEQQLRMAAAAHAQAAAISRSRSRSRSSMEQLREAKAQQHRSLHAMDPFRRHLLTRSTQPRVVQANNSMPTTAQLRAAEEELQ